MGVGISLAEGVGLALLASWRVGRSGQNIDRVDADKRGNELQAYRSTYWKRDCVGGQKSTWKQTDLGGLTAFMQAKK
jgi:hypothetical protein